MAQYISSYVQQTITTKSQNKDKKTGKNSVDPRVINEQLILESVKQFNQENNKIATENIILQQLRQLQLSFKNILQIHHLQGLEKLEKLQLDNNIIEKIENIHHLSNLKWLDLSFNCIRKIQGLEKLKELTDLSLFGNYIEKIEGLQNNLKLNVFSIGNNKLKSYEEITQYFGYKGKSTEEGSQDRPEFKHLQVLNVAGNPFTKDKENEFRNHIICAVPNLKYLDYVFIDEGDRALIKQDEQMNTNYPINTTEYYRDMKAAEEQEEQVNKELKKKKDARMDILDNLKDEHLKNEDLIKVTVIKPDFIKEEIDKYREKIGNIVKEVIQQPIIQKHQIILQEMAKFEKSFRDREIVHEKETLEILKEFEHDKKIVFRNWERQQPNQDGKKDEKELVKILEKTNELKNKLMDVEIQLVEELEVSQTDFENMIKEKPSKEIDAIVDTGQKKIEEINQEFFVKLNEIKNHEDKIYQKTIEQQIEGGVEENQDEFDEKAQLLDNKDQLNSMIVNIKDTLNEQQGKIISQAQQLLVQDQVEYTNQKKSRMYERNRKNVNQIISQIEAYQKEIREKLAGNESDSDHD